MSSNSTTTQVSAVVAGIIGAVVTIAVYFLHPSLANEAFSEGSGVDHRPHLWVPGDVHRQGGLIGIVVTVSR